MRNDHEAIRKVMKKKKYWKSYEIQTQLAMMKKFYSESSITRRLREMKDVVSLRPKSRAVRSWDYSLIK